MRFLVYAEKSAEYLNAFWIKNIKWRIQKFYEKILVLQKYSKKSKTFNY
jgi:hypothetical protein